jgi:hypothetical protein
MEWLVGGGGRRPRVGLATSIKMRGSFAGFSVNLLYISGPAFLKTFRRASE